MSPATRSLPHHCLGGSIGWTGGLAAFDQKPLTSMGICALSWRSRCGRSEDDVSRLEFRACSMLMWRIVSAELLLLMLSLAMRMSRGVQLFSILDSASVTSSLLPPARAHASWRWHCNLEQSADLDASLMKDPSLDYASPQLGALLCVTSALMCLPASKQIAAPPTRHGVASGIHRHNPEQHACLCTRERGGVWGGVLPGELDTLAIRRAWSLWPMR